MNGIGSALWSKSIADVTRRKGRSLAAILGIFIGVFGLTTVAMLQQAYFGALDYTENASHQAGMTFTVQSTTPAIIRTLQAVANVQAVEVNEISHATWHVSQAPGRVLLVITAYPDLAHIAMNTFDVTNGHYPSSDELLLEAGDAAIQSFAIGDTITVDVPTGTKQVRIAGISHTAGIGNPANKGYAVAYMSLAGFRQLTGITTLNTIQVRLKDPSQATTTQVQLLNVLKAQHVAVTQVALRSSSTSSTAILNHIFTVLQILSLVAILVTCFLIVNTMTTLIAEQIAIIGTMKAIGGTQQAIFGGYLLSVGIYMAFGTLFGLSGGTALGYLVAKRLATLQGFLVQPFHLPLEVLIIGLATGIGAPLLAALFPLWKGTQMTVRQAMAAYGITGVTATRSRFHRLFASYTLWVPQTVWLGLRGIFRKRSRALLTLLALSLSGSVFLAIENATYAVTVQTTKQYENYTFDIEVSSLGTPMKATSFQQRLLAMLNVRRAERSGTTQVMTQWGQVDLSGVEQETQIYHPTLLAGRWLHPGERHALLINDAVAHRSGLHVGQTLSFTLNADAETWQVIGILHDPNVSLGSIGSAVANIQDLDALAHIAPDGGVQWYVEAKNRTPASVAALATQLETQLNQQSLQYNVYTAAQLLHMSEHGFQDLYTLFYAVAAVVALAGGLSLTTTLNASVLERQREIGIWRSIGASSGRVAGVFWVEGMALGCLGWVVGIPVSIPLAYGFVQLLGLWLVNAPFTLDPRLFFVMLLVIVAIVFVASIVPMWRSVRVRIVDLLRYE